MKSEQIVKKASIRNKVLTALGAAVIALLIFAVAFVSSGEKPVAHAETSGSVTIHVYDASENYGSLACWVWIDKGADLAGEAISGTAASDEQFGKGKNKAHTITANLTEAQVTSLKGEKPKKLGFLVCVPKSGGGGTKFWDKYDKETDDVLVSLADAFDENNHADVYYVRKDATAYTDIEEASRLLEKIVSASFTTKTSSSVSVQFETSMSLTAGTTATLYDGDTLLGTVDVSINSKNKALGTATFNKVTFDFAKEYKLKVSTLPNACEVSKAGLIDTEDFIKTFESADTQNLEYGAIYSQAETTFRVWAPFATQVMLNIYLDGAAGKTYSQSKMVKRAGTPWGGVWEYTLKGDHKGKYYTYTVTNSGVDTETIDPYAKACGANGTRGMIVDLASTDPDGWAADKTWRDKSATNKTAVDTPIIWEVSVNDFSSSADSGMKYKGKYLAFTEQNTTVPGTSLKTGVNYLKDLGITYVHLNPVYDFATVDEGDMTRADGSAYNWGYDPQNYNIPEGSYSTDPANGTVRINEFKRMVKALHDAGIGVVMDVVYNHTYSTNGQALHNTVPYYYHRTDENGKFTKGSGCGNETASERTMMRKYMVESMKYWAEQYHIDGFRFDLMGIHDNTTITTVRTELDKIDKRILLYGEPWAADGSYVPPSFKNRLAVSKTGVTGYAVNPSTNMLIKNMFAGYNNDYPRNMTKLPDRVAVFNDSGREGLRGNNDPGKGWAQREFGDRKVGKVMKMLEGGAGGSGDGLTLGAGSRNVAYAAAHDNYTLWDQIRGIKHGNESALYYDDPVSDDVKKCKLVASAYLMSTGMSFMLAGDEMGRTKYGNENSYNSPAKLNQITWSRQETFSDLHSYYKKLIALRKQYSTQLFSYSKSTAASFCWGNFGGNEDNTTGIITFTRTQGGATLTMTLNPTALTGSVKIGSTTLTI